MKTKRMLQTCLTLCLLTLAAAQSPSIPKPPDTPRHPVTDEYQGVKVTDNYRWLEDWDDAAVKQWSAAENARTREYFDHLPSRPAIKQRLQQLVAASSAWANAETGTSTGERATSSARAERLAFRLVCMFMSV